MKQGQFHAKRYRVHNLVGTYFLTKIDDAETSCTAWRLQYGVGLEGNDLQTIDPALDLEDGFSNEVDAVVIPEHLARMIASYARFYGARRLEEIATALYDEADTDQTALEMDENTTAREADR